MNVPWEDVVAVLLYIVSSTLGFVWWMATQTIILQFVREDLAKANKLLTAMESTYATKLELAEVKMNQKGMWEKYDKLPCRDCERK